jgi:hypothetical protein
VEISIFVIPGGTLLTCLTSAQMEEFVSVLIEHPSSLSQLFPPAAQYCPSLPYRFGFVGQGGYPLRTVPKDRWDCRKSHEVPWGPSADSRAAARVALKTLEQAADTAGLTWSLQRRSSCYMGQHNLCYLLPDSILKTGRSSTVPVWSSLVAIVA